MKRTFTLLLALVMVLTMAAPALAAEDIFEVPETEEAATPEAPVAPEVPEEVPAETPAEAPDLPQTAAVEPEDTTGPSPQTGKLILKGDLDMLWWVRVSSDAGRTEYAGEFDAADIPIQEGDVVLLAMDYRYTAELDKEWPSMEMRGVLNGGTPSGEHVGDVANVVAVGVTAGDSCDLTATIVEDPDTPETIPVTWTAPEGVYVKTNKFALLEPDFSGTFICDAGYVPFFDGAEPLASHETEDGYILTSFRPYAVDSIHVDVRKATGELHITDPDDRVVYAFMYDDEDAEADAGSGIVGGKYLAVQVEAGYSVKANVEPFYEDYFEYEGDDLHGYYYDIPATGDINVEVVKTDLPVDPPKSGTGWAYDYDTGDYYYFVDGVQKFNYWANEPAASKWGYWYYVMPNGKLATGFQYVENENGTGWYMFQPDNDDGCIGRMLTGWQWTYTDAGTGWFNTGHGGVNGQCTWTEKWGAYNAATGLWGDGLYHRALG